jgi:hypothetical protein
MLRSEYFSIGVREVIGGGVRLIVSNFISAINNREFAQLSKYIRLRRTKHTLFKYLLITFVGWIWPGGHSLERFGLHKWNRLFIPRRKNYAYPILVYCRLYSSGRNVHLVIT